MATRDAAVPVWPSLGRAAARLTGHPGLLRIHVGLFAAGAALLALADLARGSGSLGFADLVAPWAALLACHAAWVAMQRRPRHVAVTAAAAAQVPLPAAGAAAPGPPVASLPSATPAGAANGSAAPPPAQAVAPGNGAHVDLLAADLARLREALDRGELWAAPASTAATSDDDLADSVLALWQRTVPPPVGPAPPVPDPGSPAGDGPPSPRAKPDPLRLSWV